MRMRTGVVASADAEPHLGEVQMRWLAFPNESAKDRRLQYRHAADSGWGGAVAWSVWYDVAVVVELEERT